MRSVSSVFGGSEPSTSDFRRRSTKGAISSIRRARRAVAAPSSPSAPAPARSRSAKVWTSAAALLWPRFRFFLVVVLVAADVEGLRHQEREEREEL